MGWAWLLLGLATDRLGATNACAAAIHVTAVRTRLWSIVNCSVAAFLKGPPSWGCGGETRTDASGRLSDCSVFQRRSGARVPERGLGELGTWTRGDGPARRTSAGHRKSGQGGHVARVSVRDDEWDRRTDA